uniref:Cinnamyl alcohol acyltransferase 1 n=1 Tax=Larrea tridentata TaxID=66636 RepID=V5NSZ9_LARTR|nr:cinnamyl alcohol acyltransferase 1 [Larrea tridentata]
MGAGGEFKVTVSKKEVVAAVLPMQEHWLPLSNLDLILPPVDVGVFFCYKKPISPSTGEPLTFAAMVNALKKALAQALVSFYAFGGEVVLNTVGEPELLCNNRGADFVEAYADIELENLNLYNPDESVEGKLVPKKKHGVFAVQATQLKCGGLVVACTFDHRIADAYSTNMFLVSWAEIAQSKPSYYRPSFRRSLLNPRRPGFIDPALDDMYVPINTLPPPKEPEQTDDHLISRIYYVTSEQLNLLQGLASSSGCKRTKLESFSAYLWKMVAKYASKNYPRNVITKMGIVVDGRTRLGDGDEKKAKMMSKYFGNVLSIPFGGKKMHELTEKPLSWVADEVHDFLDVAVTKEHFLGLIDWVEAHRPVPALAKIYCQGTEDGPGFVVSSGQRFPVGKIDFGWGKPGFGSYHFPWGGDSGYVMPMPSPSGNGDWIVYMHLSKGQLELIETEAAAVFRPLTSDYLNFM